MTTLAELKRRAAKYEVKLPSPVTVAKYGWTLRDWLAEADKNDWRCPICGRRPAPGKGFVTDHEHVRGWKNMPDEERRLYIRGLTCWTCNRYLLARDISPQTARNVVAYLDAYYDRRPHQK